MGELNIILCFLFGRNIHTSGSQRFFDRIWLFSSDYLKALLVLLSLKMLVKGVLTDQVTSTRDAVVLPKTRLVFIFDLIVKLIRIVLK